MFLIFRLYLYMKYLSSPKTIIKEAKTLNLKRKGAVVSLLLYVATFLSLLSPFFVPSKANATITESFVRFDRLATGSAISGTACLKTTTVGTEGGVIIDFPSGWTVSATPGNWTVSTTNLPVDPSDNATTATAWPSIATATVVTGLSVRFPSGDLTSGTFYCFNFAGASSTIGAAGNDQTGALKTQGGSPFVDNSTYATSIVAAGADQIAVTASVSATMTFALGSNTAALGTITSSSVTTATGITETVSTNAHNGWMSWVKSANAALHSTIVGVGGDIASPGTFNGIPEDLSAQAGYVLGVTAGSGTPTVNTEYVNGANTGGHLDTQYRQIGYNTAVASGNVLNLFVKAKASPTTPAANDYADTLTVVAAGNF